MTESSFDAAFGEPFLIEPFSRKILVPPGMVRIGAEGDCQSERIPFRMPAVYDGHDLGECGACWVNWRNANGEVGKFVVTDRKKEEHSLHFSWLISGQAAAVPGILAFSVHFADVSGDGKVLYQWSSGVCEGVEIVTSLSEGAEDYGIRNVGIDEAELIRSVDVAVKGVLYYGTQGG